MPTLDPVSYTHLDVYKRQYLGRLYEESKQRPLYLVDVWQPGCGGVSSTVKPGMEGADHAHPAAVVGKQDG